MAEFTVSFSKESLDRMHAIAGWELALSGALFITMQDSLDTLERSAQTMMWSTFMHPTGQLEDNFDKSIPQSGAGLTTGRLSNDMSYAWRREEGFSGMTDSIGRYFPLDPGIHYMAKTLAANQSSIVTKFRNAIGKTIDDITSGRIP